ncbi:MAG TPA: PqqD family peptide modification chaperone, partial [Kiloniellaceae bacterium]|nr:PqqD family peptide modification chaperone [Kiloniellaceae bacterium]
MPSSESPFSDDVSLFILEDVGIVFSEAAQEIYELNTTATWIWCQLEDGPASESLPIALADTFGFTEATARRHLSETLRAWRDL